LICWDLGKSEYRKKIFPEYKANRHHDSTSAEAREFRSVLSQMEILKDLLRNLAVAQLTYPEMEADDLIGISCAELAGDKTIVSSDQDMLHLVDNKVSVWSPIKTELYTMNNFHQKLFLSPRQWLEYRAVCGDNGDNIPGIAKGLGPTTAMEIIQKYGSVEVLFRDSKVAERVASKGNRYALFVAEGAREQFYRNLLLMDLHLSIRQEKAEKVVLLLRKNIKGLKPINKVALQEYFIKKEFVSLLKDMPNWLNPFQDLNVHDS